MLDENNSGTELTCERTPRRCCCLCLCLMEGQGCEHCSTRDQQMMVRETAVLAAGAASQRNWQQQ